MSDIEKNKGYSLKGIIHPCELNNLSMNQEFIHIYVGLSIIKNKRNYFRGLQRILDIYNNNIVYNIRGKSDKQKCQC
jgi:hypothetical protein